MTKWLIECVTPLDDASMCKQVLEKNFSADSSAQMVSSLLDVNCGIYDALICFRRVVVKNPSISLV